MGKDARGKRDTHNLTYKAVDAEMAIVIASPMKTQFSAQVEFKNK